MTGYLESVGKALETALSDPIPVRLAKCKCHGQFTSNVPALRGNQLEQDPKEIAKALIAQFCLLAASGGLTILDHVTYAAPGFLNFYLKETWRQDALRYVIETYEGFSSEKPVELQDRMRELDFEVEYAYLRICNQLQLLESLGYVAPDAAKARLELLTTPQELTLMETLAAAPLSAIKKIPAYLKKFAGEFQQFFNTSPIRGEAAELAGARLLLLWGCKNMMELCLFG